MPVALATQVGKRASPQVVPHPGSGGAHGLDVPPLVDLALTVSIVAGADDGPVGA